MPEQLKLDIPLFDADRLPRKPYCTENLLHGLLIKPLKTAIRMRYIQPNPPGLVNYLAFDVDRPDAGAAWLDSNAPRPSFIIKNPENGHAHYLYALEHPVPTTSAARLKPMQYVAAIERAIAEQLRSDPGYSGLVIKNPAHQHWHTIVVETTPYTLSKLSQGLDLSSAANAERMRECAASGLGRNCTVFDDLRQWAYKAVARHWKPGGEAGFTQATREKAHELNQFSQPLQPKEIEQIAKSVSKWVWKRFSPATRRELIERTHTPELQAKRGAKKGESRREELLPRVLLLSLAAHSTREIGEQLGIPQKTVARWIKQHHEKYANENVSQV
ncbi:replication initiation protein [Pseudomonas fulva]|uniref:replication initiation protein n=1 Tax=Pseudomonas fulva TaxID=47880 RepID=UPI0024497A92|nr:replication initiation protein [Pseudomonas fulva]MDH0574237.1 replication initiation protein [Pseudomonas fulva]